MKPSKLFFVLLPTLIVLVTACKRDENAKLDAEAVNTLTANELAELQDFHWWKFAATSVNQSNKEIQVVFFRSDKTSKIVFSQKFNPPMLITNIILGLHINSNVFSGKIIASGPDLEVVKDSNGKIIARVFGKAACSLNFTNDLDEVPSAWFGNGGACYNWIFGLDLVNFRQRSTAGYSGQESRLKLQLLP